jgi:hypothetical protein
VNARLPESHRNQALIGCGGSPRSHLRRRATGGLIPQFTRQQQLICNGGLHLGIPAIASSLQILRIHAEPAE